MPLIDQTANSLYAHFNVAQMRELALAAKLSSEVVGKLRSKQEALQALNAITNRKQLAELCHRIEVVSPYKHCVILEAAQAFTYEEASAAFARAFTSLQKDFAPMESDETGLHPQLCIDDPENRRIFLKFAHMVEVWETVPSNDKEQRRVAAKKRHVMVAEINAATQLVSIYYPGFTQAFTGNNRVTYHSFAVEITKLLKSKVSLHLEAFRMKATTDFLLDDPSEQVIDLRRTLRFKGGGKMDLDSESDEDAASVLAKGLASHGMKAISAEVIRLAFRSSEAQAIVLLWQAQEVVTRISLRNELPEMLFIWNEIDPSLTVIGQILQRLAKARTFTASDGMREAQNYIYDAHDGEYFGPGWLKQRFSLTQDQALQLLLSAVSKQLCRVLFRINPEAVSNFSKNPWVTNIAMLPLTMEDEEAKVVDLRDPKSLEITFERLKIRKESLVEPEELNSSVRI